MALAGNPNVGKSTVFNGLTGLNQHTGNWPGKTVASAQGFCATRRHSYVMVDIPGTYSLMAHSAERRSPATSSASENPTRLWWCVMPPAWNGISILFCRRWKFPAGFWSASICSTKPNEKEFRSILGPSPQGWASGGRRRSPQKAEPWAFDERT